MTNEISVSEEPLSVASLFSGVNISLNIIQRIALDGESDEPGSGYTMRDIPALVVLARAALAEVERRDSVSATRFGSVASVIEGIDNILGMIGRPEYPKLKIFGIVAVARTALAEIERQDVGLPEPQARQKAKPASRARRSA